MTRAEDNTLIAEYMGAVAEQWYPPNKNYPEMTGVHMVYPRDGEYPDNKRQHGVSMLKYHSDWNWLIPVTKQVMGQLWDMKIPHPDSMVYNDLRNAVARLEIEQLRYWTIQGIQVINKYKEDGQG